MTQRKASGRLAWWLIATVVVGFLLRPAPAQAEEVWRYCKAYQPYNWKASVEERLSDDYAKGEYWVVSKVFESAGVGFEEWDRRFNRFLAANGLKTVDPAKTSGDKPKVPACGVPKRLIDKYHRSKEQTQLVLDRAVDRMREKGVRIRFVHWPESE